MRCPRCGRAVPLVVRRRVSTWELYAVGKSGPLCYECYVRECRRLGAAPAPRDGGPRPVRPRKR